jgi:3-oxoacyl-[acyl-carrier protein] reductase
MPLTSKVALITGSSSNIGRAIALEFARKGATVIVNAKSNRQGGQLVVEEIKSGGGRAMFIQADVTDPKEVKTLFCQARDVFGPPDILVNNAGAAIGAAFLDSDKDHWIKAFETNFFSAVFCAREAAALMLPRGSGKILNTASIRGLEHTGRQGIMAYSAAKAALINFTKTLAKELAPNIQVNAVAPGFVYTPNYDKFSQELKDEFLNGTLIKRWITPQEIARAFVFLATQESITGEVLVVDGGFTLK